jgi:2-keto-4-pentenoate hydratase/2-oxohepta-3-ene-1,7-dioic acid hydratase in catechol pathway
MKIISFKSVETVGVVRTGVVEGELVYDITPWLTSLPISTQAQAQNALAGITAPAGGIMRWLQAGPNALELLKQHLRALCGGTAARTFQLSDIELYAPVPRPGKIIGVGRNYADHAVETGVSPFEKPRIIFKGVFQMG